MRYHPNLGWVDAAINAGASIYSSYQQTQAQKDAAAAQVKALQLQTDAQRYAAEQRAIQTDRIIKGVLIGGGVVVAGIVVVALIKKKG